MFNLSSSEHDGGSGLQYFIHEDPDALRMELAGDFIGRRAREAYEDWQAATCVSRLRPRIVDISFVTAADRAGKAALAAWREQGAQIVASSLVSRAIADSIVGGRLPRRSGHRGLLDRVASWFVPSAAGSPQGIEGAGISPPARAQEQTDVLMYGEMETQMR